MGGTTVVPAVPHTSGGVANNSFVGTGPVVPITGRGRRLFDDLGDDEAAYFNSALKDGRGVLALVKVDDDQAFHVRQIFSQNGARTYQEK